MELTERDLVKGNWFKAEYVDVSGVKKVVFGTLKYSIQDITNGLEVAYLKDFEGNEYEFDIEALQPIKITNIILQGILNLDHTGFTPTFGDYIVCKGLLLF